MQIEHQPRLPEGWFVNSVINEYGDMTIDVVFRKSEHPGALYDRYVVKPRYSWIDWLLNTNFRKRVEKTISKAQKKAAELNGRVIQSSQVNYDIGKAVQKNRPNPHE